MSQTKRVANNDLKLRHPFNAIISGPSQCGKTTFLLKLIESHQKLIRGINKDIIKIFWAYGKHQKAYEEKYKNCEIHFYKGVPNEEDISGFDLIIFDDLMNEIDKSKFISTLFTAGTHHDNQSVVILVQNFYHKSEIFRELRLNAHYLIVFKNPGDRLQIQLIGRRMYPNNPKFFISAFEQATEQPHGYLLIDRHQETPEFIRLRTNILPDIKTGKLNSVTFEER